jgi:hypothetical protein
VHRRVLDPTATRDTAASAALAATVSSIVAWSLGAPFAEDWDGVGFALASRGIDLAQFRPHPPGYPTYAFASRSLGALGVSLDAMPRALSALSAIGIAAFAAGIALFLWRSPSPWWRRSLLAALVALAVPGTLRLATSVGPTSLALGAWTLALGVASARPERWLLAGSLLGVSLASRPTDLVAIAAATVALWPNRAPLGRTAVVSVAAAGSLHLPLIWGVGIRDYFALALTHGAGHFDRVSASAGGVSTRLATIAAYATERPQLAGLFVAIPLVAMAVSPLARAPAARRARVALGAVTCVAWWCVAQPAMVERHLSWLAALLAVGLASALDARDAFAARGARALRGVALGLLLVTSSCGARAAIERQRLAPAAVQVAAFVRGSRAPLFGARQARAAELEGVEVHVARYEGEVWSTLSRMQRLPSVVWLTDEVEPWPANAISAQRFCGPRSSRAEPQCLRVRAIHPREP